MPIATIKKRPAPRKVAGKRAVAAVRKPNLDVERWFASRKLANEKLVRRVRDIVLAADPRMTDRVQHRTVQFVYKNTMAGFVQLAKPGVSLMFNVGASIPGRFPHLEGDGPNARFMRFADLKQIDQRAAELARIVAAWCQLQDS
jgi:hypothetical protein